MQDEDLHGDSALELSSDAGEEEAQFAGMMNPDSIADPGGNVPGEEAPPAADAVPVPDPPPPPAPPPHPQSRRDRGEQWPPGTRSPWKIAKVVTAGNKHTGWGATCSCHDNDTDVAHGEYPACKKQIVLPTQEGKLRMMQWLLSGRAIANQGEARKEHVRLNARSLPLRSEEDMLQEALLIWPLQPAAAPAAAERRRR